MPKLIDAMHQFQKKNNIKNKCMDNTQYAYDCIRMSSPNMNVKAGAVIMTSYNPKTEHLTVWGGHLAIILNDEHVIDPSYETYSAPDTMYFTSISTVLKHYPDLSLNKELFKHTIESFVHFNGVANDINKGLIRVTDEQYYNRQADFIEKRL